jgi:hypothetical protein
MAPLTTHHSPLTRRDWLRLSTAGVVSYSLSGWLEALAADTATDPQRRRACILLWMNGGPSQMDTFDLKPGHENGGPFKEIATAVPGIRISAYTPGFLGPQYAPLIVGENLAALGAQQGQTNYEQALKVEDLALPGGVSKQRAEARVGLLDDMEKDFLKGRGGVASQSHRAAYQRAVRMMHSPAAGAFDLDEEPKALRDRYGRNLFGQGCLLARRLVERGVPFVEVTLSTAPGVMNGIGWDTHQQNFESVQKLSQVLDSAWATLMEDLQGHGLLDSTLIVWMGEFGRTPKINPAKGRDHWATSWSTVLAGGGINGGQVVGRTSKDGTAVEERPVPVPDLLATVGLSLGIDIRKQNQSNVGRPIRIVEPNAQPIKEVLA